MLGKLDLGYIIYINRITAMVAYLRPISYAIDRSSASDRVYGVVKHYGTGPISLHVLFLFFSASSSRKIKSKPVFRRKI